ncbi:hypothetical protein WDU94_000491 [Cyamophila willieti]
MIETCRPAPIPEDVAHVAVPAAHLVECSRPVDFFQEAFVTECPSADLISNFAPQELFTPETLETSGQDVVSHSGKVDFVESQTPISFNSSPLPELSYSQLLIPLASLATLLQGSTESNSRVDKSIVTPDSPCRICKSSHRPPARQNDHTSDERELGPSDNGDNKKRRRHISTIRRRICSTYTLWKFDKLKLRCTEKPHYTKANNLSQSLAGGSAQGKSPDVSASQDIALRWESESGYDTRLMEALTNALPSWASASSTEQIGESSRKNEPPLSIAARTQTGEMSSRLCPEDGVSNEQSATEQSAAATERITTASCSNGNLWKQPTSGENGRSCFVSDQQQWRGVERAKSSKLFKKRRWPTMTSLRCRRRGRQLHFSTNFETDQQSSRISPPTHSSILILNAPSSSCVNVVLNLKLISTTSADVGQLPSSSRISTFLPRCNKVCFWSGCQKRPPSPTVPSLPLYNKCSYSHYPWKYTRWRHPVTSSYPQTPERSRSPDREPSPTAKSSSSFHCVNSLPSNPSNENCRSSGDTKSYRSQCDVLGCGDDVSWTAKAFFLLVSSPILLLLHFFCQKLHRLLPKYYTTLSYGDRIFPTTKSFISLVNLSHTIESDTSVTFVHGENHSKSTEALRTSDSAPRSTHGVLPSSTESKPFPTSVHTHSKSPVKSAVHPKTTRLKHRYDCLRSWFYFLLVLAVFLPTDTEAIFHPKPLRFVRSAATHAENYNSSIRPRGPICQSTDVRNSVVNLNFLNGCKVIEGFLQIFVEGDSPEDWADYSFPDLVEVTDYVFCIGIPA